MYLTAGGPGGERPRPLPSASGIRVCVSRCASSSSPSRHRCRVRSPRRRCFADGDARQDVQLPGREHRCAGISGCRMPCGGELFARDIELLPGLRICELSREAPQIRVRLSDQLPLGRHRPRQPSSAAAARSLNQARRRATSSRTASSCSRSRAASATACTARSPSGTTWRTAHRRTAGEAAGTDAGESRPAGAVDTSAGHGRARR